MTYKIAPQDMQAAAALMKLQHGIMKALGIPTEHANRFDCQVTVLPPDLFPSHDILAQAGYFGVQLFKGKPEERCILFRHYSDFTTDQMVEAIASAEPAAWKKPDGKVEAIDIGPSAREAAQDYYARAVTHK